MRRIELKLSQGAKPGHGGILPAGKVTPEIAAIRGVPLGRDGRCTNNTCPVGVATQDPALVAGLDAPDKAARVANYHHETVRSFLDLVGAAGLDSPSELGPQHVYRRVDEIRALHYGQIYTYLEDGELLRPGAREPFASLWAGASADRFCGRRHLA